MTRNFRSGFGLLLLAILFLVFNLVNNSLFSRARIDLTESQLFTLSDGSREVLAEIEEPITLYFYFSKKLSAEVPQLGQYAERVESLLREYVHYAGDRVQLQVIDPEPFSEAEDQATLLGLQAVPLNATGEEIFFGLAGSNALDNVSVIPFFRPEQEEFLEYEISKLIYTLANPEPAVVGLLSSVDIQGGWNMATQQSMPAWQIYEQIAQLYDVRSLSMDAVTIDADIDVLMIIQPRDLSAELAYAIDQYLLKGGRIMLFMDPVAETQPQQGPYNPGEQMQKLLAAWGVSWDGQVVADANNSLMVSLSNGQQTRHLGIAGFGTDAMAADDVITSGLETVNIATAGHWQLKQSDAAVKLQPLLSSSTLSQLLPSYQFQALADPSSLLAEFQPSGESYVVAGRLQGPMKTAFPEKSDELSADQDSPQPVTEAAQVQLMLIADTDLLSDRLWVQVQDFFGQQVLTPWADNAGFVINALDNFAGSSALISVRSRGRFSRPFTVVENLRREAEVRFRDHEQTLQQRLQQAEQQLAQLQQQKTEANRFMLSPEQEQALAQFQQEKLSVRKQLRDVQHQLDQDIEQLGMNIKLINIFLMPGLVIVFALLFRWRQRRG